MLRNIIDILIWYFNPNKLYKCQSCHKKAQWIYAPSDGSGFWCDNCVPRGCSCNYIDDDNEPIERVDKKGRLLPCCEFWFYPWGLSKDID